MSARVVAMAMIVLGAGCLVAAAVTWSQESARLAIADTGTQVIGQITNARTSYGKRGRTRHYITYRYDVGDKRYASDGECRVRASLPNGAPIQVWYDPAAPERAISAPEQAYGRELEWVFLWGILGAVLVGGGVVRIARAA
jgi:hypothetical protein